MTNEEKELLLKDLGARFAYHPFVYGKTGYTSNEGRLTGLFSSGVHIRTRGGSLEHYFIEEIKPYLRHMSTMTKEESKEFDETIQYTQRTLESYDWLNAHHFDYRCLIEKGLAIKAPKGMYNN